MPLQTYWRPGASTVYICTILFRVITASSVAIGLFLEIENIVRDVQLFLDWIEPVYSKNRFYEVDTCIQV